MLAGELAHQDSIGNGSTIRPGDVQRMSAGTGVRHSEFNPSATNLVHFLQIWIQPNVQGIEPSYEEKRFGADEKRGRLRLIASPDRAQESVLIHQDARVFAGLFDGPESASLDVANGRRIYVHIARGALTVSFDGSGSSDPDPGDTITYSRKVFVPLTMLCRDRCHYCTFAKPPARLDHPFLAA